MFQLLFDSRHNVLMTRLYGTYVEEDITLRDRAVARFVARHGLARGIMDFTEVEAVDVAMDSIVRRAQAPPMLPGQARVIVAPRDPAWRLNRIMAAHQLYSRGVEPLLVSTLDEAYRALAMTDPQFEPLEADEATKLESIALGVLARIDSAHDAADEERQRLRKKMLRLLDTVLTSEQTPVRPVSAITLGDVLNTALRRAAVQDANLAAVCAHCGRKTSLDACRIETGRETSYACAGCGKVMVVLVPAAAAQASSSESSPGYALGTFVVHTTVDIECPGAVLPKSTP